MNDYQSLLQNDWCALMELFKSGDEQAFTAIYDEYSGPLYRNIQRMVADEEISKELLQDLFLKLWKKRADLDAGRPLKPYLYKIASNLVYNHFLKVSRDRKLVENLIYLTVDFSPSPENVLADKETRSLLQEAINHLPPQRKQVFTLCKLEGKSYQEVSAQLNISVGTINDHVVKGNRAIKAYFLQRHEIAITLIVAYLAHYHHSS